MDSRALNRLVDTFSVSSQAAAKNLTSFGSGDDEREKLILKAIKRVALNGGGKVVESLRKPNPRWGSPTRLTLVYAGDPELDLPRRRREWIVQPRERLDNSFGIPSALGLFEVRLVGEELPEVETSYACGCVDYDDGTSEACEHHAPRLMTGEQAVRRLSELKDKMLQGDTAAAVEHRALTRAVRREIAKRAQEAGEEETELRRLRDDAAQLVASLERERSEHAETRAELRRVVADLSLANEAGEDLAQRVDRASAVLAPRPRRSFPFPIWALACAVGFNYLGGLVILLAHVFNDESPWLDPLSAGWAIWTVLLHAFAGFMVWAWRRERRA